jgi:PhoPQ-activated pathogenicity-related protein
MTTTRLLLAATLACAGLRGAATLGAQATAVPAPAARAKNALERYVETPDPVYRYEVVSSTAGKGFTTTLIEMTSQSWRSEAEVDRPIWKHWLFVVAPSEIRYETGFLYITGGNNNSPAPRGADESLVRIATTTKSVVAELRMVPNQPLAFADKRPRVEDDLIAYTWDRFLQGGDERWPARLPMTKAAVRAMDTVTAFCATAGRKVDRFVVAGASKRGWTAWTTAAVDGRVVGIVPFVIDLLNLVPSFAHHHAAYGYYAPAVADYEDAGIMNWLNKPRFDELMRIEEPFEYRERFTMPKFLVNATGDQFFLPDSWQFYLDALPGSTYVRYVPNADHSLRGSDAWTSALAFYASLLEGRAMPRFTWKIAKDGTIAVDAKDTPVEVKLWQITNPGARDFRLSSIGARWKSSPLAPSGPNRYLAKVPAPRRGFTAYMIELTYPSGVADAPFKLTTGVKVIPDVAPFKQ